MSRTPQYPDTRWPAAGQGWFPALRDAALVDGQMVCVEVNGCRVLLARSAGHCYAADEMCTHEDASLCLGALREGRVKCPLHGSWFDLADGSVYEEPATESLQIYTTRIRDGWLEICLPYSKLT